MDIRVIRVPNIPVIPVIKNRIFSVLVSEKIILLFLIQIFKKRIPFPVTQILDVMLIAVCLPLKRNIKICTVEVPVDDELDEPFYNIPCVERNPQHLSLLTRVNQLVVDVGPAEMNPFLDDDKAKEVDGGIVAERDMFAMTDS